MNRSELPQEIVDDIIDYHRNDKPVLGTCSLVCRTWSFRARHHLFADVVITKLKSDTTVTLGPIVTRCFRNVHLYVGLSTETLSDFLEPLIGVHFENAVSLVIHAFEAAERTPLTSQDSEILHHLTPCIVNLRVSHLPFETTDHFTKFICGFQHLETLAAVNRLFQPTILSKSATGFQLSFPDNLRAVDVSDDCASLARWLLSFHHLPPIHTIDGVISTTFGLDVSTSCLLRKLGASLETVRLVCLGMLLSSPKSTSIHITRKGHTRYQLINLCHHIRLRSLHLDIRCVNDDTVGGIASVLSRIVSMHMESVSFTFLRQRYQEHDLFDDFDWAKMDEALAQPIFANLKRVEITILLNAGSPPSDMERVNSIVDRLPGCHSKGILLTKGQVRTSASSV